MVNFIKSSLFKILGLQRYLKLLHVSYHAMFSTGLLKRNSSYKYNYFAHNFINAGDTVLDLGANLGYFSKLFCKLVGPTGRVICIEPVQPFFNVLTWSLGKKANCTLYNYALGNQEQLINMSIPKTSGVFRTGLAAVNETSTPSDAYYNFTVQMMQGSKLLADLPQLHYIKCDIEGYEEFVFPEIKEIIKKHLPIIQVETWGSHKEPVFDLLLSLGYDYYRVYQHKLVHRLDENIEPSDYIFIHNSNTKILEKLAEKGIYNKKQ